MSVDTSAREPEAIDAPRDAGRPDLLRIGAYVLAAVLAIIPVVRMTRIVLGGSPLQYADYWSMLGHFANPDGSLHVAGLFEFQNHPVVVAQLIYWLNMQLFDGSNIVLGLVDIALVLGALGVIGLLLHQSSANLVVKLSAFVMASWLLFTLNGTWNYVKAMSGTAWFTANLFVLVAVLLRSKDRSVLAFGVAVLAAISYGTGVVVWPALIAVGLVRRPPRQWWRELPFAAGLVATFIWYRIAGTSGAIDMPGPRDAVASTAALLTQPLGLTGSTGRLVGYLLMAGIVVLAGWCVVRVRTANAAAWVGVATFGLLATFELALGRQSILDNFGEQNRYASIAALAWIGFAGLVISVVTAIPDRVTNRIPSPAGALIPATTAVGFLAIGMLAVSSGDEHADEMQASRTTQEIGAIALHLGVADDSFYLVGPFAGEKVTPRPVLQATGNYPYDGRWDGDCGLLDQTVEPVDPVGTEPEGTIIDIREDFLLRNSVLLTGTIDLDRPIRCMVVVDQDEKVVGAATIGRYDDPAGEQTFVGVGRPGSETYEVLVMFEDGDELVRVGNGPLAPPR